MGTPIEEAAAKAVPKRCLKFGPTAFDKGTLEKPRVTGEFQNNPPNSIPPTSGWVPGISEKRNRRHSYEIFLTQRDSVSELLETFSLYFNVEMFYMLLCFIYL